MDINDILSSYENGQLLKQDDSTLDKAADALDYARKHYFDGIDIGQLNLQDFQEAQGEQRRLRTIADSIRTHLVRRYGCDD
jgi:hypothetical protein